MGNLLAIYNDRSKIKEISILKAFIIMGVFTAIPLVANFLIMIVLFIIDENISLGRTMIIISITVTIANILTIGWIAKRNTIKDNFNMVYKGSKPTKKDLIFIAILIIGYILIREALLTEFLMQFDGPFTEEDIKLLTENSTELEFITLMGIMQIQALIEAPIFEEILFRGIVLSGLLNKYKHKPKKAIVYSALVFAIVHFNIPQGINAFIGGIILGSIFYYTKSLRLSIFAHFINNFFVFLPMPSNLLTKLVYLAIGLYMMIRGIKYIKDNFYINSKTKIYNIDNI